MILIKNIMIGSCEKTTELIEKKSAIGLSFIESIKLYFHLRLCTTCKRYESTSKKIDEALNKSFKNPTKNHTLSSDIKKKILNDLHKAE